MSESLDEAHQYNTAVALVVTNQKSSTSWLQRQMRLGYNSAARLIARMEHDGIVSAANHVGARQVLTDDLVAAAAAIVAGDLQSEPAPNPPTSPAHVAAPQEKPMTDHISAEQLRLLIERIERLEEEKKGISDDIKDVYAEAKSTGFDVKTMREVVKLRKMEKHHRDEAETLLEVYKQALGI